MVGGISRTVERDGWRFDIGGHRFFTKVPEVEAVWHEILPDDDFLLRPRLSRIYYQSKYFDYPLSAINALKSSESASRSAAGVRTCGVRIKKPKDQTMFEGWVAARFGWRLYHISSRPTTRRSGAFPPRQAARRLGRAANQEPVARQGRLERDPPQAQPEGDHLPHRGVPVPEVRAGDDVGGVPRHGRGRGHEGAHADRGHEVEHRDSKAVSVTAETEGVPTCMTRPRSSRRCP